MARHGDNERRVWKKEVLCHAAHSQVNLALLMVVLVVYVVQEAGDQKSLLPGAKADGEGR